MNTPLELFQSFEALLIIIFSLVALYYAIRILIIHILEYKKLMVYSWLTIMQALVMFLFGFAYVYILVELLQKGINVACPQSFGALFIRPIILLNNIIATIYLKIRFIETVNIKRINKSKEETNAR